MKTMAIGFYGNSLTHLSALKAAGWCDTYYLPPNKIVGGIPGTVDELKRLKIDFRQYEAALIFQEGLDPAHKYFNEQCIKYGISIYANQHGFNKSILQIADITPNIYSKYWNCMGPYFLDRFKEVMGRDALSQRWICIGSLMHDYLYKNYKWREKNNNGRALIIHEPDLRICEGDERPHDSEGITRFVVESLMAEGITADMKPHPNWKNFIGNKGESLEKPKDVNLVDIRVEDIINYALVIGSRSTMLLDAVAMGVPTVALESSSEWQDDKYPPIEEGGLVPTFTKQEFVRGLRKCFNQKPNYDESLRNYFLGPLGQVAKNYYDFIQNDLKNPSKILGKYYFTWQHGLNEYVKEENKIKNKLSRFLKRSFLRKILSRIKKIVVK